MAEFLTTNGTANAIETIILEAINNLVLVSPYVQLSKINAERLTDAGKRGVTIKMIYGKTNIANFDMQVLRSIPGIELYYLQNLHAKCYFNDEKMVMSSMNLYEYSQHNNREMGILLHAREETEVFQKAAFEVKSIIDNSEVVWKKKAETKNGRPTSQNNLTVSENSYSQRARGFCVRCGTNIPFDPDRPYCKTCFSSWNQFQNIFYSEPNCHCCGQSYSGISMTAPQCFTCFRKSA
ncbi:MAG: hypothetical protein EOO09_11930 [Chitinophagaceae bacterium]|nr:MAG: hypothetical protein EOO09_11930 [Chitinophagaceae bacterium]